MRMKKGEKIGFSNKKLFLCRQVQSSKIHFLLAVIISKSKVYSYSHLITVRVVTPVSPPVDAGAGDL